MLFRSKQRTDMLVAALKTGGVGAIFVLGLAAASGTLVTAEGWWSILLAFLGGVVSGLVVTAMLPAVEALFGYTTNIKLLELANLNSPLLKDLAIRAPGTFHHSILVGNLVEIAAESIHANPLLARVGAYYHDVGKLRSANYFAENQKQGKNPHDKLAPSMSALILKEHVRDGARLLRSLGYPKILADICEQHTGTTLISFFYHKARSQAAERGEPEPLESDYRYPGPRPQTREAALVFLGDSVEAAAKSMADPTPARLQGMVNSLISARFIDGQLGECNLSLGDLNQIAQAFTRGLMGIYHSRPEYPGASRGKKPTAPPRRTTQTPVPGKRERSSAESLPASKAARQERTPLPFDRAALAAAPTEVPGSITELPAMLARQLSQLQFPGGDDHPPRPDPSSPRRGAKRSADEQPSEAAGEVAGDRAAGRGALPAGAGGERAPAAPVPGDLVPPGAGDPDRRGES